MTKNKAEREWEFDLSGGVLCLDFANTVSDRGALAGSRDHLQGYEDLIFFAQDSGILSSPEARRAIEIAGSNAQAASAVHRTAIALREAIYRVFAAATKSQVAKPKDVKMIEEFATEATKHRKLSASGREYRWEWKRDKDEMIMYTLWPIAQSAADLLTSDRLKKVRECEAPTCAWLFLDESRNHSRRWCDMKVCGNREKAKRHYERGKKQPAASDH